LTWIDDALRQRRANQVCAQERVTKDAIKRDLAALGVADGDTVFFHSSLKSIGYV